MIGEEATKYKKKAVKKVPRKADHKHEYFREIVWRQLRRFDGTLSKLKYKFSGPPTCIECGFTNRKAYSSALEVEISIKEYDKKYKKR